MKRPITPGAPRTARDRAAAAKRSFGRWQKTAHAAFARLVAARSDRFLEGAPIGPVFRAVLPFALRAQFRSEYAVDHDGKEISAVILLDIHRHQGQYRDRFDVVLDRRRCRVRRHRGGRPDATLRASLSDMIRMASGAAETAILVSDGQVVTSGDAFLLARFPAMFRLPTRPII